MKEQKAKTGVLALEKRSQPRFNIELALDYAPIDKTENLPGTVANANEGGILVYLPEKLVGARFYEPSESGWEKTIKERLRYWRERKPPTEE